MCEFTKIIYRIKINIQRYVAFLYTNDELPERGIRKTIPFKTASKIIK